MIARLRARDPQLAWEASLAIAGVLLIGLTYHYYPAYEAAYRASAKPLYSPAEADRQIDSAKSYLTAHPDDINSYVAISMAYFQKGPDHYVESLNALEKARALGATSDYLFFYAGVMYETLGLPDYAINEYSKYLRHHSGDYETMIRLANLYFRQKRTEEAEALYKVALHEWPKDATAWFNAAVLFKEKGNYPLALNALEQVKRIAGKLPEGGLYEEGEIYRLKGDTSKALQYYQQELAVQPSHIPSLEATEAILKAKGDLKQARNIRKRIVELKKQPHG